MKIVCKHNGTILSEYGFDNIHIDLTLHNAELTDEIKEEIAKRIQFRNTDRYDFEYGIGGFVSDEYYKIKNMQLANNNTEIVVRVSKV